MASVRELVARHHPKVRWTDGFNEWAQYQILGSSDRDWEQLGVERGDWIHVRRQEDGELVPVLRRLEYV